MKLREPLPTSRAARRRKTLSFNEADLSRSLSNLNVDASSPQVILSQEDLSSGSVIQSEVILKRASLRGLKDCTDNMSTPLKAGKEFLPPPLFNPNGFAFDETDSKLSGTTQMSVMKIKGHRRIQSDGNIRPSTLALGVSPPKPVVIVPPDPPSSVSAESQDYDIISDSELASSVEAPEEYLVVDGFIDQTMESFTPKANREQHLPTPDVLYHLRLGLMQLLKNTLMLLPDNLVTRVFGTILKVEHLLVLVNQTSDKLREVALEVTHSAKTPKKATPEKGTFVELAFNMQ